MEKQPSFIVEHLDKDLYAWCVLEYRNIFSFVPDVLFTNVTRNVKKLGNLPCDKASVASLPLQNACILDPAAEKTFVPDDKFSTLIFGGILGNAPAQGRTKILLSAKMDFPLRNLGKDQLSTDTAVLVAKKIMEGAPLERLEFVKGLEIPMREGESVILPYKYLVENGKPLLTPGIVKLLKRKKGF